MGRRVFIDVGHGGSDSGAVFGGIKEKDINLTVALEVKKILLSKGLSVLMSRESDIYLSLDARTSMANRWDADIFISIHHNAGGGVGAEVIHSIYLGEGKKLADKVATEFKSIGQNVRNVYSKRSVNTGTDYFAVIRGSKMPSIITEFAFLDSNDRYKIDTVAELKEEGRAIAKAILDFFGLDKAINNIKNPSIKYGEVTASILNVREKASINSPVIGQLVKGTKVKIGNVLNGWYGIYFGSHGGYVSADYIKEVEYEC